MTDEKKSNMRNNIVGAIFVFICTLCFSSSVTTGKYLSSYVSISHIIFWRSIVAILVISIVFLIRKKMNVVFKKMTGEQVKWTVLRAIIGTVVIFTLFLSSYYGEMSKLGSILNLNPVVTVILAFFILKEVLNVKVFIAVLIAIVGVLFIVGNPFTLGFSLAYPLIFVAMFMISLETISIRKMNILNIDIVFIVGSTMVLSLFVSLPQVLIEGFHYSGETILFLLLVGVFDVIGHLSVSTAGKFLTARTMSIFMLVSVFEYMMFGIIFFGEKISLYKILGALMIIVASVVSILVGNSRKSKSSKTP